ncbi:MAG: hypothetical protein QOF33_3682 [Thermomicrobiales bacterium]|jgi:uncharacterized protein with GYD domain|nr:hypothetical protein [Thermomicrobiales bacterium]MEA2585597.1 hypothetical protein [Thermomicrobiales bacterium]MEA2596454.1 hypothetical protein [Thermomicrobiales bacterium]
MALYLTQAAYTAEAWAAMAKDPADRPAAVRALAERFGCKLLAFYYCFGEYDSVLLIEGPDETSVASALIGAAAAGHLRSLKTTQLLTNEQGMEAMRKAGTAALLVPGR